MVSDSIVRPVVGPDLFSQIARALLLLSDLLFLSHLLFTEHLIQLLSETGQGSFFVLRLLSVLLRHAHYASWNVSSSACTISLIYVLTTSSLSSHKVQSDVLHVHGERARNFWNDENNSC